MFCSYHFYSYILILFYMFEFAFEFTLLYLKLLPISNKLLHIYFLMKILYIFPPLVVGQINKHFKTYLDMTKSYKSGLCKNLLPIWFSQMPTYNLNPIRLCIYKRWIFNDIGEDIDSPAPHDFWVHIVSWSPYIIILYTWMALTTSKNRWFGILLQHYRNFFVNHVFICHIKLRDLGYCSQYCRWICGFKVSMILPLGFYSARFSRGDWLELGDGHVSYLWN